MDGFVGGDVDVGEEAVEVGVDDLGVFGGEPVREVGEDGAEVAEAEAELLGFDILFCVL